MKKLLFALFGLLALAASALAAVNINTATPQELEALPGIGPSKAKAIVDYRAKNGPFKTPEDIKKVAGIGDKTFEQMKKDIVVTGKSSPSVVAKPVAGAKPAPAPTK